MNMRQRYHVGILGELNYKRFAHSNRQKSQPDMSVIDRHFRGPSCFNHADGFNNSQLITRTRRHETRGVGI